MHTVADRSRWVVALVLCLLVPVAGVASATVPEGEPNDTPWDATPIESGVAASGTVDDLYNPYTDWYDQDYFLVHATGGRGIAAELDRSGGSGTLYVAIGTLDNVPLTEFRPVGVDESRTVRTTAPETGWYLVYVTGYLGHESAPGTGAYTLTAHAENPGTSTTPDLPDPTETFAPPVVPDRTDPSTTTAPASTTPLPTSTETDVPLRVPAPDPPGSTLGLGPASFVGIGFAGFLVGYLTGNAEDVEMKRQALLMLGAVFGSGGLISLSQQLPVLGWLVVAGVVGVVTGLLAGTLVRNAGLTYAPR
ncbi:MAG: hypothetical protein V5A62_14390 [Haloarculaceae archaeon]